MLHLSMWIIALSFRISQIENQKLLLKDFEIVALCKVLNISYEQLFENTDNIFD